MCPISLMKTTGEAGRLCLIALLLFGYTIALPAAENADAPPSEPTSSQAERTVLPEMTVTASPGQDTSYSVPNATTATKTDTPIMETPVSIQVVPRQVIEDQRANRIDNVIENISGIRSFNNSIYGYVFNIRGFRTVFRYRNNLLLSDSIPTVNDTANLERLEVLKGPGSILYGRNDPGGIINLVTKSPWDSPYYSLEQEFGSFDHYRTVWDATGPLTEGGSLTYRISGAYQDSGSFRDFNEQRRTFVNPVLRWQPTATTEMKFEIEYLDHEAQNDIGIPAIGNRPAPIPISRSLQEPNDPLDETYSVLAGFQFRHDLTDSWTIHNRFHAAYGGLEQLDITSASVRDDNRTVERGIGFQELDGVIYATNLDLVGAFDLLGSKHDVLFGFDYLDDYYDYTATGVHVDLNDTNPEFAIDIFNPRYGEIDPSFFTEDFAKTSGAFFSRFEREQYGVYFQDHITLIDKLHILGGGRYDWASVTTRRSQVSIADVLSQPGEESTYEKFSPRVGVLYQPWPWIGVYGSWSQSFGTNNGISASGEGFPTEHGEQWEAGLKAELFEQRLNGTLAFYYLTKDNLLTPDLSTPEQFDSIAVGEQRSQGIELDILGQITDELGMIGSYAYTDGDVTKDNSGFQGNELRNVAKHSGSLFLTYEFKRYAPLNGLRLGFGAFAVGARQGDLENTFMLPGYVRLDAFASYSRKVGPTRLTAQLNIRNLTDKDYFEGNDAYFTEPARLGIFPGAPLTAIGSLRVEF